MKGSAVMTHTSVQAVVPAAARWMVTRTTPESSSVAKGLLDTPLTIRRVTPRALRTLRLLGVTDLMQDSAADPLRVAGLRVAYDGPDARVYRISGALPRAFVAPAQGVVGDDRAALRAVTSPGFDATSVVVTEKRVAGLPERSPQGAGAGAARGGAARIVSYEPERVVVRASSAGPGMLVLGDNHYPGWKATVNGRSADIERVDYLLRGVRVRPGTSTVEFRYQPLSWRIGWILSLLALIGLVAAGVVGRRRRAAPDFAASSRFSRG